MPNWKEKLDRLPVLLYGPGVKMQLLPTEYLEGDTREAHYIATRTYVPLAGVKYSVLISGALRGRLAIIEELTQELGEPELRDCPERATIWMIMWPSSSDALPRTKIHEILGEKRIREIMNEFGLSESERRTLQIILATLAMTIGPAHTNKRMQLVIKALEGILTDRVTTVTMALLQIHMEFTARFTDKNAQGQPKVN